MVEVDETSRPRGVASKPWAIASVRLKTLRVLKQHPVPSNAVDEVEKIVDFVGTRLAPKEDTHAQPADGSPTMKLEVPESILVLSLSRDISHCVDSPLGIDDGTRP